MKIIATTTIRHSTIGEQASGHVLEVDWTGQRIIKRFAVPDPMYPESNTNPRGGLRGGRGVKVRRGHYFVANYDTVHVYDSNWRLQDKISHPLATDIHEIDLDASGIWLSCSRYDMALKLDYGGEKLDHWHISDSPGLMRMIGVRCGLPDLTKDYRRQMTMGLDHTHLNCVQIGADDSLIVNLGQVKPYRQWQRIGRRLLPLPAKHAHRLGPAIRGLYKALHGSRSFIVKLNRTNSEKTRVLGEYPALRPNHNGQMLSDETSVLAAEDGGIVIHHIESHQSQLIPIPASWARGIAKIEEQRLLVGIQPCAIVEVDLRSCRVTRRFELSDNPDESVHGLALIR